MTNPREHKDRKDNIKDEDIQAKDQQALNPEKAKETGGPKGLEPTRYGDWEKAGRCIDF